MALETEIIVDPIFGARAVRKLIKDAADTGEEAGQKAGKSFSKYFAIESSKASRFIGNSFKNVFKGIATEATKAGALIAGAIGTAVFVKSIQEANKLETAFIGLKSVAAGLGTDISAVDQAAKNLASDGLIPVQDVTDSLKNLLVNFNGDLDKSVKAFNALKNSAAFNRQAQLSLGEAIRGASEGLKNDLSIKVDNAGITKNLSILQKEYAASIGTTVGKLTEAQKSQAEYVGILKEGAIFQGDYNRLLQTFSGAVTRASTSFKFLLAEFGSLITRSPAVINVTNVVSGMIEKLTKNLKSLGGGDVGKTIIQTMINVGRTINDYVVKPLVIIGRVGIAVFQSLETGLNTIIAGFGKLGGAIAFVLEKVGLGGGLTEGLKTFSESSSEVLTESANKLNNTLTGIFDPITFSNKTTEYLDILQRTVDTSGPIYKGFSDKAKAAVNDTTKTFRNGAKQINAAISGSLARGLSSSIQKVAQNLAEGKSLFSDFGQFIFGLLGDVMVQVGQAAIAFGIATSAIQSFSPTVAIAAGAALVAVGTILKSLSGGKGGSAGSISGSQGGFSPSVGGAEPEPEAVEESRQEPDTNVSVVINGDVFDSDETGVRITQILNNAFEKDGVVVKGASFA